jgi:hypothetical protein
VRRLPLLGEVGDDVAGRVRRVVPTGERGYQHGGPKLRKSVELCHPASVRWPVHLLTDTSARTGGEPAGG